MFLTSIIGISNSSQVQKMPGSIHILLEFFSTNWCTRSTPFFLKEKFTSLPLQPTKKISRTQFDCFSTRVEILMCLRSNSKWVMMSRIRSNRMKPSWTTRRLEAKIPWLIQNKKVRSTAQNYQLEKKRKGWTGRRQARIVVGGAAIGSIPGERIKMEFSGDFTFPALPFTDSALLLLLSVSSTSLHFSCHICQDFLGW